MHHTPALPPANAPSELEDLVAGYGVRASTVARISELGFTASTLLVMTDRELDDMTAALSGLFRWDLLIGERFGLRAALRAERGRLMALHGGRHHGHQSGSTIDGASQEGECYQRTMHIHAKMMKKSARLDKLLVNYARVFVRMIEQCCPTSGMGRRAAASARTTPAG
jgi:hypothetical protein